ncbi:hypothetical protein CHS0354_012299 [Potamilus streckersoni]|uniref:Uncharacterized protein n=1 Tax=Potamilus streckersoni TaxID=2493646 RepID=A0AAE0SEZ3_9BIVA|nr:hypothetical protein CHS0354_012299 [Potamilus streckersoni]
MRLIELNQLTLLNAAAIGVFSLAMLFQVIAYTTDHWCTFNYEGIQWNIGLWRGCWRNESGRTQLCTTEIFKEKWFNSGKHWSQGTSAMMSISLACLFLLELVIICYACVKQLERFRDRIVGAILALSCAAGFCHFIVLLLYGLVANGNLPESTLSWSYGFTFIPFILEISIPVFVNYDKCRRYPNSDVSVDTGDQNLKQNKPTADEYNETKIPKYKPDVSKVEAGPYTIEEGILGSAASSMHTSLTTLSEYTRRPSFSGSLEDSFSYGPYYEEGSIESLV